MKESKALLVTSLIARRAASWNFDIISTRSINKDEVSDEAMERFANEILSALDILDEPEPDANQQITKSEG